MPQSLGEKLMMEIGIPFVKSHFGTEEVSGVRTYYLSEHEIRCEIYPSNEGPLAPLTTPPVLCANRLKCFLTSNEEDLSEHKVELEIEVKGIDVVSPGIETKDKQKILFQICENILVMSHFPKITFEGTVEDKTCGDKNFKGILNIRGQKHYLTFNLKEERPFRYSGHVVVRQSNFGIKQLSLMGGCLRSRDEVLIIITVCFPMSST